MRNLRWARRYTGTWYLSKYLGRGLVFGLGTTGCLGLLPCVVAQSLPEAPSTLIAQAQAHPQVEASATQELEAGAAPELADPPGPPGHQANAANKLPSCEKRKPVGSLPAGAPVVGHDKTYVPCQEENPLQPIIGTRHLPPLTPRQKGYLAVRDVIDPFNVVTIVGYSGIAIASNSRTAYGPGFRGFGRLTGYSFVEDVQGEFFGTFLIPTLAHEDPRYYRIPGRSFPVRLLHAVTHTVVTRHDDGSHMLNFATLLTYPISAELTNLYVPGVAVNGPSTAKRVGLGLATDPVGQIVAEFLPDVAKRIHIRVIFVQQILQQVAQGSTGGPVMTQ